jgi:hypothetical protein
MIPAMVLGVNIASALIGKWVILVTANVLISQSRRFKCNKLRILQIQVEFQRSMPKNSAEKPIPKTQIKQLHPTTSISVSKVIALTRRCTEVFEEVRSEMRALIYFMIGMSLLGIGILLSQAAFAIGFLSP